MTTTTTEAMTTEEMPSSSPNVFDTLRRIEAHYSRSYPPSVLGGRSPAPQMMMAAAGGEGDGGAEAPLGPEAPTAPETPTPPEEPKPPEEPAPETPPTDPPPSDPPVDGGAVSGGRNTNTAKSKAKSTRAG